MLVSMDMLRLNQVLKGIKICQSKSSSHNWEPRLPVTPEILLKIKTAWEHKGLDKDKVMLWAAFTTCFFGFLCSGEIYLKTNDLFDPVRDLTSQDVEVDNLDDPKLLRLRLKHQRQTPTVKALIYSSLEHMTSFAHCQHSWPDPARV